MSKQFVRNANKHTGNELETLLCSARWWWLIADWTLRMTHLPLSTRRVQIIASRLRLVQSVRDGLQYWLASWRPHLDRVYSTMLSRVPTPCWHAGHVASLMSKSANSCVLYSMGVSALHSSAGKGLGYGKQVDVILSLGRFSHVCKISTTVE